MSKVQPEGYYGIEFSAVRGITILYESRIKTPSGNVHTAQCAVEWLVGHPYRVVSMIGAALSMQPELTGTSTRRLFARDGNFEGNRDQQSSQ